jgi:hypothetical protein
MAKAGVVALLELSSLPLATNEGDGGAINLSENRFLLESCAPKGEEWKEKISSLLWCLAVLSLP